jgi:hypothetical protein
VVDDVNASLTTNDWEPPPPPGVLVVSKRLLMVAFAEPVTAAVAVILNCRSTY